MVNEIRAIAERHFPAIAELRHTIHRCPELAQQEYETAGLVRRTLADLGLPAQSGIAGTGVVSTIRGGRPGPAILLRADMDALPLQEKTGASFASVRPGIMHACGHDVHTASLLGAAMILHELRPQLSGTVRLVFQPSEELLPGGARPMIDAGVLTATPDCPVPAAAFAQHVRHSLPAGTIGVRSGMLMASSDEIYIRITGTGGHAAEPHRLKCDAVLAAAHVIVSLQGIVSRHCPPDVPSVLSIGKVEAHGATNVIPETVSLAGTFRAMDERWRNSAHALIRRTAQNTAKAYGARAEVDISPGYPALRNDPREAELVRSAAVAYVGEAHTVEADLWFASEDFAYFLREIPGALYFLGVECPFPVHTPYFLPDDRVLLTGAGFMAYLAWRFLRTRAEA